MIGKTISHFEILSKLGEGGMGVVYKARDIRLNRLAAIKVLPPSATLSRERKLRFFQEAKAASALNHPNIVTVYEIDHIDGLDFIAMEYVDGKTLDRLIPRKGMRLSNVFKYSVQIADAIAAAHGVGIVHRDLKPGNVMVTETGLVKVLDFGLAKLTQPSEVSDTDLTRTVKGLGGALRTGEGTIMGTAAYMSPEQAEGLEVDGRSDIFSFGLLLYEVVTGRRAFQGASQMSTVAAIIMQDPAPVREVAQGIPVELERVINRCLQKDRNQRWQAMADVKISLEDLKREDEAGRLEQGTQKPRPSPRPLVWLAAAFLVAAVAILGTWLGGRGASRPQPTFDLRPLTADAGLTFQPAISPDGTLLAYASDRAGNGDLDLWVQQIAGGQPIPLTTHRTDDFEPAFSPDGSQIAFRSDRDGGGIFLVPALGGNIRMIAKGGHMPRFSPDGRYVAFRGGDRVVGTEMFTVDLQTGAVKKVALEFGESAPPYWYCYHPIWSPDGTHLLFANGTATSVEDWWVVPAGGGAIKSMNASAMLAQDGLLQAVPHAWSPDNTIFFSATAGASGRESLWQLEVSPNHLDVRGPPVRLTFGTGSETQVSTASTGRFVFASREHTTDLWSIPIAPGLGEVTGKLQRITQGPAAEGWPTAATAGNTIAYVVNRSGKTEFTSSRNEIWIENLTTHVTTPFIVSAGNHQDPLLSPDGAFLLFRVQEDGNEAIYRTPTSGGIPEKVCDHCGHPCDMASDGRTVLRDGFSNPSAIGILDLESRAAKVLLRSTDADLYAAQFSRDGRWIAFHARAFQGQTRRILIAPYRGDSEVSRDQWLPITDGSSNDAAPQWSHAGDALYFLSNRDGFQCLWAQRLDPATKRPVGSAVPISHFHQPRLSATNISNPGIVRPTVTRDKIILTLAETTGNIWMMEPRLPR